MKTCGECVFGKPMADNLTLVRCEGMPPQIALSVVKTPAGPAFAEKLAYPNMERGHQQCALFRPRVILEPAP